MEILPLLVAVDFSRLSPRAVEYAVRLARGQGRRVDLLHVTRNSLSAHAQANAPAEVRDKVAAKEEAEAQAMLDGLMERVEPQLRGDALLTRGSAADVICEYASRGYELVVVSTHGRTGIAHALVGSVAERVVRFSPIPVLVVR